MKLSPLNSPQIANPRVCARASFLNCLPPYSPRLLVWPWRGHDPLSVAASSSLFETFCRALFSSLHLIDFSRLQPPEGPFSVRHLSLSLFRSRSISTPHFRLVSSIISSLDCLLGLRSKAQPSIHFFPLILFFLFFLLSKRRHSGK